MASKFLAFTFCTVLIVLNSVCVFECTPVKARNAFSMRLIHRDSHNSPLHDPGKTNFHLLNKAFGRSLSRASYLKDTSQGSASSATIVSQLAYSAGEYVMKISIGTPPVDIVAIADTGSDVTWTQCEPCNLCYKQDAPIFDTHRTSTYNRLSCKSSQCESLDTKTCDRDGKCQYDLGYKNGYGDGDLATETFTFQSESGGTVMIPEVAFGCTFGSVDIYNETYSGIVGLGRGSLSIVNQLLNYTGGKFSYCLVPLGSNQTSKIHFGNDDLASGPDIFSTPLFKKTNDTYYYINLEGISVGNTRLSIPNNLESNDSKDSPGNIIVDSGTTLTLLPSKSYDDLESTLINSISGKRVSHPEGPLSLCFEKDGDHPVFPELVLHFTEADIKLPPWNSFAEVADGVICLVMAANDEVSILGNISQMNFLIEFDLEREKLNFTPTDCTKEL